MLHLLDTPQVAALLHARPAMVSLVAPWMLRHDVATSILVYGEVIEYIRGRPDFEALRRSLRTLLREVRPLPLNYRILEGYADLRRQLRPPYGPGLIGDIDTIIAATALEHDLTLVTTDTDFQRGPGLKLMLLPRTP